jgi:hypothetical protein
MHALNVISGRFSYVVSLMTLLWDLHKHGIDCITQVCVGQDSSVGIATRYSLDGPGIESR